MNKMSLSKVITQLLAPLLLAAGCTQTTFPPATAPVTAGGTAAAEPTAIQISVPEMRTVQSAEFGVSLSYAEVLAGSASIQQVAAVAMSPDRMYIEAHPAYINVLFDGIAVKRPYRLTTAINQPQVMIFRTADFASYGPDSTAGEPAGFPAQQARLAGLLKDSLDPRLCTTLPRSEEDRLPYLPWTNAAQAFCAQLKTLEFGDDAGHGRGIRYLTHYTQGISVVLEGEVFYTFQGLTDDGQYYISMVYPVETGVFDTVAPDAGEIAALTVDGIRNQLAGQIVTLNGLNAQDFNPPLDKLDAVVESIKIK